MPRRDLSLGLTQSHALNNHVPMQKSVDARVSKLCRECDEPALAAGVLMWAGRFTARAHTVERRRGPLLPPARAAYLTRSESAASLG